MFSLSKFTISYDILKKLIEPFTAKWEKPFDIMGFFVKYTRFHPDRPEGWFELARIKSFIGLVRSAKKTLMKCFDLSTEYQLLAEQDSLLKPLLD